MIKIRAELQCLRQIAGRSDKKIDSIGSHMVAERKPPKAHATGIDPVVVPDLRQLGMSLASEIGIGVFDPQIHSIALKHLWDIDASQERRPTWDRKLRPFIFRPDLSIELQAGRKWNQIGHRGNSQTEIDHGLFVDLLIATLIRRMEVGVNDDFGK